MLYEVAVVLNPTKKEAEGGAVESLVYGPTPIIANSTKSAEMKALRSDAMPKDIDVDRIQVFVRSFA